jgi:hypothetical protein
LNEPFFEEEYHLHDFFILLASFYFFICTLSFFRIVCSSFFPFCLENIGHPSIQLRRAKAFSQFLYWEFHDITNSILNYHFQNLDWIWSAPVLADPLPSFLMLSYNKYQCKFILAIKINNQLDPYIHLLNKNKVTLDYYIFICYLLTLTLNDKTLIIHTKLN